VAICPTTEANLGDGLFPLRAYLEAGGSFGVGSDSQISVSPVEELRWLEYGQRLVTRHRNIAVGATSSSVGETLLRGVLASGAQATGQGTDGDWLILDDAAPQLAGATADDAVDRWLFSGNRPLVRDVILGGERVVTDGRHRDRDAIAARYSAAMRTLLG
jgi:formimidoylglutamate deiminase